MELVPGGIDGGRTLINGEVAQPTLVTLPDVKRITVFPRVIAAATNIFTLQETAATIRGRLLNEGGVYSSGSDSTRGITM